MSSVVTIPEALIAATGGSNIPTTAATSTLSTPPASISSSTAAYSAYSLPDALPHTNNHWIAVAGDLALYNPTLLLVAEALFQHTAVFGILFLLRGFSPKRALDLHYLTIVFALSFVAAPIVFLVDLRIDQIKLLFFLEHEAVEFLVAIRVLAPATFVARRSGLIVLLCWCGLVAITVPVVLDTHFHHAADLVAWCAFASDLLVGVSGVALVRRWVVQRPASRFERRQWRAEAMAGLGFMLHGFITMSVGPILALVLYHNLNPAYFAYAWVAVFLSAFFAVGFAVPVAGMFFSNIRWCISHRKPVFPGQAEWREQTEREKDGRLDSPTYAEAAPQYATRGDGSDRWPLEDLRSPHSAWNVQLPEERSTAWRGERSPPHQSANSNIYYRDVLKDLLRK